jgi:outer membrane protein TolC
LSISAQGGFESSTLKHLFDWPSRFWAIGPSAAQTIFNGGLYRAQLHQYEAIYNADLATYRQSVLTAFQQVEDYLAATRILSQQILRQQEAIKSSQEFLDLEMQRYNSGIDPYVDVVTAQTTLLGNQVTLNSLQVQEMLSSVQLVEALGGGWDRTDLPTPSQASAKVPPADYKMQN